MTWFMKSAAKYLRRKKGCGWMKQGRQVLVIVEADVGYLGNHHTNLSAPVCVSTMQISRGRSRHQICRGFA